MYKLNFNISVYIVKRKASTGPNVSQGFQHALVLWICVAMDEGMAAHRYLTFGC